MNTIATKVSMGMLMLLCILSCRMPHDEGEDGAPAEDWYYSGVLYDTTGAPMPNQIVHGPGYGGGALLTDANGVFTGYDSWSPSPGPHGTTPSLTTIHNVRAAVGNQVGLTEFTYGDLSMTSTYQVDIHMQPAGWLRVQLDDTSHLGTAFLSISRTPDPETYRLYQGSLSGHYDTTYYVLACPQTMMHLRLFNDGSSNELNDSAVVNSGDTVTRVITF